MSAATMKLGDLVQADLARSGQTLEQYAEWRGVKPIVIEALLHTSNFSGLAKILAHEMEQRLFGQAKDEQRFISIPRLQLGRQPLEIAENEVPY